MDVTHYAKKICNPVNQPIADTGSESEHHDTGSVLDMDMSSPLPGFTDRRPGLGPAMCPSRPDAELCDKPSYNPAMTARTLTALDRFLISIDHSLRTAFTSAEHSAGRAYPAATLPADELSADEKQLAGRLMRINHAGEVAAQALYQGQGLTSRNDAVREAMATSAREEIDHLAWCETRLDELDAATSRLDPLWYLGSFMIGASAGLIGDAFSLGFVAETENQVVEHLQSHLQRLPTHDVRSRTIIEQMAKDESHHGESARRAGGKSMPAPIRTLMRLTSKLMTRTAYWI